MLASRRAAASLVAAARPAGLPAVSMRASQLLARTYASEAPSPVAPRPPVDTQATDRLTKSEAYDLLVRQRRNRPLSPDLTIYKPQITMVMSGLHRIFGLGIGAAYYLYALGFAFLPYVGYGFTSASVAAAVAGVPFALKFVTKLLLSYPLTFHSWNGIRHLIWDAGKQLTIPQVYKTGYIVLGLSAVTSLLLALA